MRLRMELMQLLNRHSAENGSNTPDFILANYLAACLSAFDWAVRRREAWHGRAEVKEEDFVLPGRLPGDEP